MLDCSTGFVVGWYGNRVVPSESYFLDETLACTSFSREFRIGHRARRSVALQPCPYLLRGNHGWRFVMWMWGTRKLRHSVQKNN
jgi:hypothetical protein